MRMEIEAEEYTCDGCGKVAIVPKDAEPPLGLGGNVYEVHNAGGDSAEWWACSRKCVAKAIANALNRGDR